MSWPRRQKFFSTINIAMYYLTSPEVAQEIVNAKKRGVAVRIFLDKSQRGQKSSQLEYFTSEGVAVRIYEKSGLMHNKFAVLDNKVLITGSFNWTLDAEKNNQENLLIITDKRLIEIYAKQFERLWTQGKAEEARKSLQKQTKEVSQYLIKILKQIAKALFQQMKR
ncbi:MAG: phospholipase D-like domain-containing protein [Candidatus Omnitrophica bacterium]|nr:phospholipase D-like domain-containing protein [Candidatus Omnitrophota bacterium]